jgi:hypothetical protein
VWTLQYFMLFDQVGNQRTLDTAALEAAGFPTTLTNTGVEDSVAPRLREFDFAPRSVDAGGGAVEVTFTGRLTDDLSGISTGTSGVVGVSQGRFVSPSGQQIFDVIFGEFNQVAGTSLNATYQDTVTIPQYSEAGVWTLQYFMLFDQVGNQRTLDTAALEAAGFPTTLTITE